VNDIKINCEQNMNTILRSGRHQNTEPARKF